MVREVPAPKPSCGGIGRDSVSYSGCITSRKPVEFVQPPPRPATGRMKCVASGNAHETDRLDELIHYSNTERTTTLCGHWVTELRPFMGSVMWGSAGFRWCKHCEAKIVAGAK